MFGLPWVLEGWYYGLKLIHIIDYLPIQLSIPLINSLLVASKSSIWSFFPFIFHVCFPCWKVNSYVLLTRWLHKYKITYICLFAWWTNTFYNISCSKCTTNGVWRYYINEIENSLSLTFSNEIRRFHFSPFFLLVKTL